MTDPQSAQPHAAMLPPIPEPMRAILQGNLPWGWEAQQIDGVWCVGLRGNLDTRHDAAFQMTGGMHSDAERQVMAEWLAAQLNLASGLPARPEDPPETEPEPVRHTLVVIGRRGNKFVFIDVPLDEAKRRMSVVDGVVWDDDDAPPVTSMTVGDEFSAYGIWDEDFAPKQGGPHTLHAIGWRGALRVFLDVPLDEAIARYAAAQGAPWNPDTPVKTIESGDQFGVYDIGAA